MHVSDRGTSRRAGHQSSRLWSRAYATSSARVTRPIFCWTCARWDSTVRTLRNSEPAISLLVWPSAISFSTSSSRGERLSGRLVVDRLDGELRGEFRVQIRAAFGGEHDRVRQLRVSGIFEHVAERAGPQRRARERRILLHRQYHDLSLRRVGAQLRDRVQARYPAHVEVQDEDLRAARPHRFERARHIAGLVDHAEPVIGLEQYPEPRSDHAMVVGEDDRDRSGLSRGPLRCDDPGPDQCATGWMPWSTVEARGRATRVSARYRLGNDPERWASRTRYRQHVGPANVTRRTIRAPARTPPIRRASSARFSAGCVRGATPPCGRSSTAARRSRCWCDPVPPV